MIPHLWKSRVVENWSKMFIEKAALNIKREKLTAAWKEIQQFPRFMPYQLFLAIVTTREGWSNISKEYSPFGCRFQLFKFRSVSEKPFKAVDRCHKCADGQAVLLWLGTVVFRCSYRLQYFQTEIVSGKPCRRQVLQGILLPSRANEKRLHTITSTCQAKNSLWYCKKKSAFMQSDGLLQIQILWKK